MMKVLTGTDIIEVNRVKNAMEDSNFDIRVFTVNEREYCEKFGDTKYQHYAARFAAKEAIFKAISPELTDKYDIGWANIEIEKEENGRPRVKLISDEQGKLDKLVKKFEKGKIKIDVSLSHIKEYAVAMAAVTIK